MLSPFYSGKCKSSIVDMKKRMYNIESVLENNVSSLKNSDATKYDSMKQLYDVFQMLEQDAYLRPGTKNYATAFEGLESITAGIEVLEKSATNLGKYKRSTINSAKSYVETLDKAIKEPEHAKEYIHRFISKSAKKKNIFTNNIARDAYTKSEPEDKIKVLKAYTNGVLDASAMETFSISDADVNQMITDGLLRVKGYKMYIIK